MAINLVTLYQPYVDELFTSESKIDLLTNKDFKWTGAHSLKIFKVSTAPMTDYDRAGTGTGLAGSRYGDVGALGATTEEFVLSKDRSFTFAIDRLDTDETARQLEASSALARQLRQVVVPEIDKYVYGKMSTAAGTIPAAKALTAANIYDEIIAAGKSLDNFEVPDTERFLILNPDSYVLMKKSTDIIMSTEISNEERIKGVIGMIDGCRVFKVPDTHLPAKFGFLMGHKVATVAAQKLEDYKIHEDPPGISGSLVEGRIVYDAFVMDNKAKALYYQAIL